MTDDLIAPSRATSDSPDNGAEATLRKPWSAWLTQLVVAGIACADLFAIAATLLPIFDRAELFAMPAILLMELFLEAGLLWLLRRIVVGIQRRDAWGRWGGLASIGVVLSVLVWVLLHPHVRLFESPVELVMRLLIFAFGSWWLIAFGFSSKARHWFACVPNRGLP